MSILHLNQVRCAVCHGREFETICTSAQIEANLDYVRRFHLHRLNDVARRQDLTDRSDFTQGYATNIVACRACGLVFRNPRPSESDVERLYARDRYGRTRLDSLYDRQRELYRPKTRMLREWLCDGAVVVEVGSFVGGFLSCAAQENWQAIGVDPGDEVAEYCRSRGFVVHSGTLPDVPLEPHSVDCIAVWNTLDQIPDPAPLLEASQRLLRPAGILAVRIPNGEAFRWTARQLAAAKGHFAPAILRAAAWNNILAFPYLQGFSVPTLDFLMEGHGFRRIAHDGDNLCLLSDDRTKLWAQLEERFVKSTVRALFTVERLLRPQNPQLAPWLDIIYQAPPEAHELASPFRRHA